MAGNTHPTTASKPTGRYDTLDKANEVLLQRGYRCAVVPDEESDQCITLFSGVSSGVMLLNYFNTAADTLAYFRQPDDKCWQGNILFRALSAILTISHIQDCYEHITGQRYTLPALPTHEELYALQQEKEPLLREGHSFAGLDAAAAKLKASL